MNKDGWKALPANLVLTFTGAVGALFCFISAFGIEAQMGRLLLYALGLALLYTLLFTLTRVNRFLIGGFAALTGAAYFFVNQAEIAHEGLCVLYRVLHIGAEALGRGKPMVPPELSGNWTSTDTTAFFLFVLMLFVACLAWAVAAHRSFSLSFLLTMLFLAGPLFLTITPGWAPLMLVLAFWTVMLLMNVARHSFNVQGNWMGLVLLPIVAVVIFSLGRAVPQEEYTRSEELNELRVQLTMWDEINLNTKIFAGFGVGSLGKSDFTNTGDWHTNGALMLRVVDEGRRANYLRGNTGAVYTGKGWEPIPDREYRALQQELSGEMALLYGVKAPTADRIALQYIYADKRVLYAPYFLTSRPSIEGLEFHYDRGMQKARGEETVSMNVAHRQSAVISEDTGADMQLYGEFVKEQYLQVPDALRASLTAVAEEFGIPSVEDGVSYEEITQAVMRYLGAAAVYSLSPGDLPRGEDFVEYFLFENKQGYCIHFATAGALLLRTQGVPARYADGYVVREKNFNSSGVAEIPDRQAHAWVEVFYDGIGWLPAELTPGASVADREEDNIFDRREEPTEAPLLEQTPAPLPSAPTLPPAEGGQTGGEEGEETPGGLEAEEENSPALWIVLCILALLAGGAGLRAYGIARRKRTFAQEDTNACVIAMYLYLDKLAKKGSAVDAEVAKLAEKAQFSQHRLAEDELMRVCAYVDEYRANRYREAGLFDKAWLFLQGL